MSPLITEHIDRLADADRLCQQVSDNPPAGLSITQATRIAATVDRARELMQQASDELKAVAA